jgi:hypothetical protein
VPPPPPSRPQDSKRTDFYKLLGLQRHERDLKKIKKGYKTAALKWHPDKHSDPVAKKKAGDMFLKVRRLVATRLSVCQLRPRRRQTAATLFAACLTTRAHLPLCDGDPRAHARQPHLCSLQVGRAYEVLKDPHLRSRYERGEDMDNTNANNSPRRNNHGGRRHW